MHGLEPVSKSKFEHHVSITVAKSPSVNEPPFRLADDAEVNAVMEALGVKKWTDESTDTARHLWYEETKA